LAGRNLKICLKASDEWGLDSIERCVLVTTGSCKACLKVGQTLNSLAAEYSTDWLQIWATNPRMGIACVCVLRVWFNIVCVLWCISPSSYDLSDPKTFLFYVFSGTFEMGPSYDHNTK